MQHFPIYPDEANTVPFWDEAPEGSGRAWTRRRAMQHEADRAAELYGADQVIVIARAERNALVVQSGSSDGTLSMLHALALELQRQLCIAENRARARGRSARADAEAAA